MSLVDQIYAMYKSIKLGSSSCCRECCKTWEEKSLKRNGPAPIYHVGECFNHGILFIGFVGIGWGDMLETDDSQTTYDYSSFSDDTKEKIITKMHNDNLYLFFEDQMQHRVYSFIRVFCQHYFSTFQDAFDKIAITNFLRCNHGKSKNNYPADILYKCINIREKFYPTLREIEILRPSVVIDMSGKRYRYILESYKSELSVKPLFLETPCHPSNPGVSSKDYHNWSSDLICQMKTNGISIGGNKLFSFFQESQ